MAEEEQWTEEAAAPASDLATAEVDTPEIKLFNKWPLEDIQISDISLSVSPTDRLPPRLSALVGRLDRD